MKETTLQNIQVQGFKTTIKDLNTRVQTRLNLIKDVLDDN